MAVKLANNVRSKLAVSVGASETELRVLTGHGQRFPALSTSDGSWFPVALENVNGEIEFCRATFRNGDVITVARGQEGSMARAYSAGDALELRLTVAALMALSIGSADQNLPRLSVSSVAVEDI